MFKKFISLIMIMVVVSSMGVSALAVDRNDSIVMNELKGIDFNKELSEKDKKKLYKFYKEDSERVFNDEYGKKQFEKDQNLIKENLKSKGNEQLYVKDNMINDILSVKASSALGSVGDILVTYSFSSLGADWGATGHAAIVHTDSAYTIESFPKSKTHEDGVRRYLNTWKNKSKVYGQRVSGASLTEYKDAAKYAITQADAKKSYNWNFFNKGTTSKFYCSQLVWRAWMNQGYDIDRMNLGKYEPVSPAELVGGSNTYTFYHEN